MGFLLNVIYYSVLGSTACLVHIQAICTQQKQGEFLERLAYLQSLRVQDDEKDHQFNLILARRFMMYSAFVLSMNLIFFYLISSDPQWTKYQLAGVLSSLINRMFCLKVFLFLELLCREVSAFHDHCLSAFVEKDSGIRDIHIGLLLDWHSEIIELVSRFRSLFDWSVMFILLDGYLLLGSNTYWSYVHFICRESLYGSFSKQREEY